MSQGNPLPKDLDAIARQLCGRLLSSHAARLLTPQQAEGLVIIAFAVGAAWALDLPDIAALIEAQLDARQSEQHD